MGYMGFRQGLGMELVKLVGTVGGFFLSFRYYQPAGDLLAGKVPLSVEWSAALTMVFLAGVGYFAVTRLFQLLGHLGKMTFEKKIEQSGGLGMGLLRGALTASVLLVVFMQLPAPALHQSIDPGSLSGKTISRMAPAVYDALNGLLNRLLN